MTDRRIPFEVIQNTRELGGLVNRERRRIRPGLLIRSASLFGASAGDVRKLAETYRLGKIIDLRTNAERGERPDAVVPGVEYCAIPVFGESVAGISHESGQNVLKNIPALDGLYRRMIADPGCRRNLGRAAITVMEQDFSCGSVLWHCTEGKDRCGLLTMVLLLALEVDREEILADYLQTNETAVPKSRQIYQWLLASGKPEGEAGAVRNMLLAKECYLQNAFEALDEGFESSEAFLTEGLSIPKETICAFREKVLMEKIH